MGATFRKWEGRRQQEQYQTFYSKTIQVVDLTNQQLINRITDISKNDYFFTFLVNILAIVMTHYHKLLLFR
jgi:hypothetical protein